MTCALLASCILFMAGEGHLRLTNSCCTGSSSCGNFSGSVRKHDADHCLGRMGHLAAELTPDGTGFFASALRANLYVLLLVMLVPAVLILPRGYIRRTSSPKDTTRWLVKQPTRISAMLTPDKPDCVFEASLGPSIRVQTRTSKLLVYWKQREFCGAAWPSK